MTIKAPWKLEIFLTSNYYAWSTPRFPRLRCSRPSASKLRCKVESLNRANWSLTCPPCLLLRGNPQSPSAVQNQCYASLRVILRGCHISSWGPILMARLFAFRFPFGDRSDEHRWRSSTLSVFVTEAQLSRSPRS